MTATEVERRSADVLVAAAGIFAVAVVVHGFDHLRRGSDATARDVFWVGTAAIVLEVGVVLLVLQRHRLAPLAAAVTGFSLAAGYVLVHFLPARSWLSDSLASAPEVNALSWVAAALEVVAALLLGAAGMAELQRRGGLESAAAPRGDQRRFTDAARHPAVVTMAAAMAVILVASLLQY